MVGSGELEFEEFCMLASKFLPEDDSEEDNPEQLKIQLKEAFRFYDRGGIWKRVELNFSWINGCFIISTAHIHASNLTQACNITILA